MLELSREDVLFWLRIGMLSPFWKYFNPEDKLEYIKENCNV